MPNVKVIGGQLDFNIGSTPFRAAYYSLDNSGTDWSRSIWSVVDADTGGGADFVPIDTLWSLGMTKEIADGVNVNLTYACQQLSSEAKALDTDNILDDVQLLVAGVVVPF